MQKNDTFLECRFKDCDIMKHYYSSLVSVLDSKLQEDNEFNVIEVGYIFSSFKKKNNFVNVFEFAEVIKIYQHF